MSIRPAWGRSSPIRYRNSELLPHPDPPRIAKTVPRSTWKVTCSIRTRAPQPILKSLTVIWGINSDMSDAYQHQEERKHGTDHDHAKNGQNHSGRRPGADSGSAAPCE